MLITGTSLTHLFVTIEFSLLYRQANHWDLSISIGTLPFYIKQPRRIDLRHRVARSQERDSFWRERLVGPVLYNETASRRMPSSGDVFFLSHKPVQKWRVNTICRVTTAMFAQNNLWLIGGVFRKNSKYDSLHKGIACPDVMYDALYNPDNCEITTHSRTARSLDRCEQSTHRIRYTWAYTW